MHSAYHVSISTCNRRSGIPDEARPFQFIFKLSCLDEHVEEDDDDDDSEPDYGDGHRNKIDDSPKKPVYLDEEDEEEKYFNRPIVPKYETTYRACDKKSDLYLLQQERFLKGKPPPSKGQSAHSR